MSIKVGDKVRVNVRDKYYYTDYGATGIVLKVFDNTIYVDFDPTTLYYYEDGVTCFTCFKVYPHDVEVITSEGEEYNAYLDTLTREQLLALLRK